jgi:membrane protein YdbS with pleckstrin-like domain
MTDYIQDFKSKIDETSVRKDFPEITDTEIPVWQGNPSFLSMADKYILAILVFGLHILFFIAEQFDSPEGDGQLNAIVSLMRAIIDISGTMGFVIAVFLLAKINHYANFSTSGRWTTTWLIITGLVPFTWYVMDVASMFGGLVGSEFDNPLPAWNNLWFLPLGIISSTMMIILTFIYQHAFQYAITDRRIHIRKSFLIVNSSVHGIAFDKVENLKANPPILGRIFGFGNVHILTASGLGLQQDSFGSSVGVGQELTDGAPGIVKKIFSLMFGWVTKQRQRTAVAQDPADCLYGVRNPMKIYRLINELMDVNTTLAQNNSDSE